MGIKERIQNQRSRVGPNPPFLVVVNTDKDASNDPTPITGVLHSYNCIAITAKNIRCFKNITNCANWHEVPLEIRRVSMEGRNLAFLHLFSGFRGVPG